LEALSLFDRYLGEDGGEEDDMTKEGKDA